MSSVKPFRAYRPRPDLARQVASFPYDVISSDEARALAAGNPYSFLHVGKPEIDLDPAIPRDGVTCQPYRPDCPRARR